MNSESGSDEIYLPDKVIATTTKIHRKEAGLGIISKNCTHDRKSVQHNITQPSTAKQQATLLESKVKSGHLHKVVQEEEIEDQEEREREWGNGGVHQNSTWRGDFGHKETQLKCAIISSHQTDMGDDSQ